MAPAAQVIRNNEVIKTEYSEKSAIGTLYDELSKGIVLSKDALWNIKSTKKYIFNLLCRGKFHNYGNSSFKRSNVLVINYKENTENQQINFTSIFPFRRIGTGAIYHGIQRPQKLKSPEKYTGLRIIFSMIRSI